MTEKNDNMFLNALNDIDDDLVEEIAETPVEPEIISTPPKKSRFIRFVPAAASLAVVAAVGIGAMIVGNNILSPLNSVTTVTDSQPASSEAEQSGSQTGSGDDTTTSPQSTAENIDPPSPSGVLSRPVSEVDIPNISGYSVNFDVPHDGIITSVNFDTKEIGDYTVSLDGSGVFTDFENSSENIIFAHKLTVNVKKGDKLIDLHYVYDPLDPDAPVFKLMKDHLDSYMEIAEYGQDKFMVIFRSLNSSSNTPVPEALFFWVENNKMYESKRIDLPSGSERKDRSETLSAAIYTSSSNEQDKYLIDELTGNMYTFTLLNDDYAYYMQGKNSYPESSENYTAFDPDSLPVIDEFTYTETEAVLSQIIGKTVVAENKIGGGYTLRLLAQNVSKDSSGQIHLYNPQTVILKNGNVICHIDIYTSSLTPYGSLAIEGNYTDFITKACIMDDTLLIIDSGLGKSYFGEGCFYALHDDNLYALSGYWQDMDINDPPAWTEGKQGYDLTVDTENQTVICGFMKFTFDLSEIPAMYNYTVSWLEEPIE